MSSKNNRVVPTESGLGAEIQVAARARQVLRQNDMGDWTRAAPNLYPHQWSWDSAFIAIGLVHDRYIWLVKLIKRAARDETTIYDTHPFLVKDVLFSAILVAANECLLQIAQVIDAPDRDRDLIAGWIERGRRDLEARWDPNSQLCLDYNVRTGKPVRARTVAGFAPLISGGLSRERLERLLQTFDSPDFAGNPKLRWPLPPSTGSSERSFDSHSYWRGPVWPVANWLLWWSLVRAGEIERAAQIRRASLDQIARGGFAEYFDPFSGAPLGSFEQSWTAAVALD